MWSEVGKRARVGPALIKEAEEQVAEIREKLKDAQSRQKSYADKKRREVSFNPGDFAYQGFTYLGTSKISSAREVSPLVH
jgi:hypothetical protein